MNAKVMSKNILSKFLFLYKMCMTFVISNNNISVIGENYENKYTIKEFLSDLSSLTLKVENVLNIVDVTGLYKCRKLKQLVK